MRGIEASFLNREGPRAGRRAPAGAPWAALAGALILGLGLGSAALAPAPAAAKTAHSAPKEAPIPRIAPRPAHGFSPTRAREAIGVAAGAARDQVKQLARRLTIGAFSVNPPAAAAPAGARGDGAVAEAIRRAFAGRRLDDLAGSEAGLPQQPKSGVVGYVLADPSRGAILERRNADARLIPASVSKAPTALYALDALGPDFRFETRLLGSGRVENGVLRGDLYLVGGGDPVLDNKDLAALAKKLRDAGVKRVAGRFYYDDSAIEPREAIEPSQPLQAGYNPPISGLNINFNRVRLSWERENDGYRFGARTIAHGAARETDLVGAEAVDPDRAEVGFALVERPLIQGPAGPQGTRQVWRISSKFLGGKGGRWLPARRPGALAAAIFQELAHEAGVALPAPRRRIAPAGLRALARHQSARLADILTGMLKHSTNLTAEAVGLAASRARGLPRLEIERSAALMSSWADTRFGILGSTAGLDAAPTSFFNHSGLSVESRLTPRGMTAILIEAARDPTDFDTFFELLPRYRRIKGMAKGAQVRAKTGTVYYGRGLAGYLECPNHKRLAFAYLHSDLEGRALFDESFNPANGGKSWRASGWLGRARAIERGLLLRWSQKYC